MPVNNVYYFPVCRYLRGRRLSNFRGLVNSLVIDVACHGHRHFSCWRYKQRNVITGDFLAQEINLLAEGLVIDLIS